MSVRAQRPSGPRRLMPSLAWGGAALAVVVALVLALLWFAPFLRLESVEYQTAPSRETALREAAVAELGQPLAEVDTSSMEDAALSTRLFSSVSVTRAWPSTLVVRATPREAVVAVTGPGVSGMQLVDAEGVAFETVSSLPEGLQLATTAHPGDPTVLRALATVVSSLTPALRQSVEDLRMDSAGVMTFELEGTAVTWGDAQESRLKAAVLRDLVQRDGVARIDVSAPMAPVTSSETAAPTPGQAGTRSPGTGTPTETPTPGTDRTAGASGTSSPDGTDAGDEGGEGAEGSPTSTDTPTGSSTD